jgi:galactokinase
VTEEVWAPGRVNLIGEHIDYHGLAVLPMATRRRIRVRFEPRDDRRIRAASGPYGEREFTWEPSLEPVAAGDWENYLRAAAQTVAGRWSVGRGVDAHIESDLPAAAGLASSTALIVAFTLCLLRANRWDASFEELMEVLPEGEQFVGTRGGSMDHAASLGSRAGCASRIAFGPLAVRHIPAPADWGFLVAHSLQTAEKSGSAREAYNARRRAGYTALHKMGLENYRDAIGAGADLSSRNGLSLEEHEAFLHTTTEARRVEEAVSAMECGDAPRFGRLLSESHASLRDRLRVSSPALDRLVEAAMASGALGARLTGAGFGGCAVILASRADLPKVRQGLVDRYFAGRPEFRPEIHLIDAEPGPGALAARAIPTSRG